ncbi:MAG: hypothetical protein A3A97_01045 [Candidatus Terrybacteria bacterium RIFCSPLOWO2_01_FULL_40_23]|uniref:Uncharacterized protein n=1 Tax=Candidatus Terrybacteria bacterium RIFCSPLOWO2_01_FULL_40_23 TaxID=1802366 RepID=A0A1G2PYP5_9BACT|nr:MAG: hypothetical protein A3A97_01045 [Candidatus Terrybacteria bacterium RIFCSPLOWO2_01_FULL_40_23]
MIHFISESFWLQNPFTEFLFFLFIFPIISPAILVLPAVAFLIGVFSFKRKKHHKHLLGIYSYPLIFAIIVYMLQLLLLRVLIEETVMVY